MIDLRECLAGPGRKFARLLAAVTLMLVASFLAAGEASMLGALFAGYMVGFLYLWTLVYRTYRSAGLSAGGARRQMLWGLCLRLAALFAILLVAARISTRVFAVCAGGFICVYGLAMLTLVGHNIFDKGMGK